MNTPVVIWTEDEDTLLKKHWKVDLSARAIGALMGKTRMAVIGRANRIGLGQPMEIEMKRRSMRTRSRNAITRLPKLRHRFEKPQAPPKLKRSSYDALCDVPILNGVGVPFWQLKDKHCRFIPGEPSSLIYCGHQTHPGSAYCTDHHHFVTRKSS